MTTTELTLAGQQTEVGAKPRRRRFTVEYKRKIVKEADAAKPGQLGALLRREGLYSSHLTCWRAARDRGELAPGATARKRGPLATAPDPRDLQLAEQGRELARWQRRAERAEALVDVKKKLAALLGSPSQTEDS